jgi:hypothetical protein
VRFPWKRQRNVLDDQLDWMTKSIALIEEADPEAARRLRMNIRDRLSLPHRETDPMDRPRDVTELVIAELNRLSERLVG